MSEKRPSQESIEAAFLRNRLRQLHQQPIAGDFDVVHLKAIHAHLFQDLPQHRPGILRGDTEGSWIKNRALEGSSDRYSVHYAHKDVEARLTSTLQEFGGPETLKGLPPKETASRIAKLYGDLDHLHGFYEGNSRTLREFTRTLAGASGHTLNWAKTSVGVTERNELYIVRDIAALERAFPDLTPERAMTTSDRAEYEVSFKLRSLRQMVGEKSLETIVADGLSQDFSASNSVMHENSAETATGQPDATNAVPLTMDERAARAAATRAARAERDQAYENDQSRSME